MTNQTYTPDARRLSASLAAIYSGHPDAEGLPAARRVAMTAADLLAREQGADPNVVNVAALFHLAGEPDDPARAETSALIARAWLLGVGAPQSFVESTRVAILGVWGVGDQDANGRLLWHAATLDLTSVERHADYLKDVPGAAGARAAYLSRYRREYLTLALRLDG